MNVPLETKKISNGAQYLRDVGRWWCTICCPGSVLTTISTHNRLNHWLFGQLAVIEGCDCQSVGWVKSICVHQPFQTIWMVRWTKNNEIISVNFSIRSSVAGCSMTKKPLHLWLCSWLWNIVLFGAPRELDKKFTFFCSLPIFVPLERVWLC